MAQDNSGPTGGGSSPAEQRAAAIDRARRVVTAVVVGGRPVAEVAAAMGVSRSWVYELVSRYRAEGETAFEPQSRAPKTSPRATPKKVVDLVLRLRTELTGAGHDAGPDTIAWHLARHHDITLSRATVHRILARHGRITPEPRKRPRASRERPETVRPNQTWQCDHTAYLLVRSEGLGHAEVGIFTWLDDCTRYALHVSAHREVTLGTVLATLRAAATQHGVPVSVLTDNGRAGVGRGAAARAERAVLEAQLRDWGTRLVRSGPASPGPRGKVGRFHQTLRRWLRAQPRQPASVPELQALLDQFRFEYNTGRPHRSLPQQATPAVLYESLPRVAPPRPPTGDSGMS